MLPSAEVTRDILFDGRLTCLQGKTGYRFTQDAVLLAHFVNPRPDDRGLDLGTGCGIISLILAYRWPTIHLTSLEFQPSLAELARRNVLDNQLAERVQVISGDWRNLGQGLAPGSFDWVVCNPPYYQPDRGRLSPHPERAMARHELEGGLADVVRAARLAVHEGGRVFFVCPADRAAELINEFSDKKISPQRMQLVHVHPGGPAKLVLLEGVVGDSGELTELVPFFIYQAAGVSAYSPEMARCYAG